MIVEWADRREAIDFVVPTKRQALRLIREGACNRLDLLEQAGLTPDEAAAELRRIGSTKQPERTDREG